VGFVLFFLVREAERRVICQRSIALAEWERERGMIVAWWIGFCYLSFDSSLTTLQRGWWELSDTSKRWLIAWDYLSTDMGGPVDFGASTLRYKRPDLSEFDAFSRPQRKWCKMAMELSWLFYTFSN
jgi:hypothetical protein